MEKPPMSEGKKVGLFCTFATTNTSVVPKSLYQPK